MLLVAKNSQVFILLLLKLFGLFVGMLLVFLCVFWKLFLGTFVEVFDFLLFQEILLLPFCHLSAWLQVVFIVFLI